MKGPDGIPPKNPGQGNPWAELEQDPRFQHGMVIGLIPRIMDKKFGKEFMAEYFKQSVNREPKDLDYDLPEELGERDGEEDIARGFALEVSGDPLIPEVREFEERIHPIKTIAELQEFLRKEGIEITEDDIRAAKHSATLFIKSMPPRPE